MTQNALKLTLIAPNAPPCKNRPIFIINKFLNDTPDANIIHPIVAIPVHSINDFDVPTLSFIYLLFHIILIDNNSIQIIQ